MLYLPNRLFVPSRHKLNAFLLATIIVATASAHAQFTSWTTPGVGNWFQSSNWDNGIPVAGFIATIGHGVSGTAQVSFGTGYAQDLILGDTAAGTLTIDNGGTVSLSGFLELGKTSAGTLNLNNTGTLRVSGVDGIRSGVGSSAFNFAGGSIFVRDDDLTSSVPMALSGTTSSINVFFALGATFSGELSGSGNLNKLGTGSLTLSGTNTYTGSTNVKSGSLTLSGNNLSAGAASVNGGSMTVSGAATVFQSSQNISVGNTDSGTFSIVNGAQVATSAGVTVNAGYLTLSDSNSRLQLGGNLAVGSSGEATVNVSAGSLLSIGGHLNLADTSAGTAQVYIFGTLVVGGTDGIHQGAGSALLAISGGTLKVTGSDLTSNATMSLNAGTIDTNGLNANFATSLFAGSSFRKIGLGTLTLSAANPSLNSIFVDEGILRVSGSGASLVASSQIVSVGKTGSSAILRVEAGASATIANLTLGGDMGSSGTLNIDGSGSVLGMTETSTLTIGGSGSGTVNVTNGGALLSPTGYPFNQKVLIGGSSAGGVVNVTGSGSLFQGFTLIVGNEGPGTLNIGNGGSASFNALIVGEGGAGTVNLNPGGVLQGQLFSGAVGAHINLAGGTLISTTNQTAGRTIASLTLVPSTTSTIQNSNVVAPISGSGSLKIGSGVTTFYGAKSYTGTTTVATGGDLYLNGSITSDITIQQGGILRGGTVKGITLDNGGLLVSRNSMVGDSLTWNGGGQFSYVMSLNSTYTLNLNGAFTKGTSGDFAFLFDFRNGQVGKTYDLINFTTTNFSVSDFSFVDAGPYVNGNFSFDAAGDTLRFTLTAVPEPSIGALIGLGVIALTFSILRRRSEPSA